MLQSWENESDGVTSCLGSLTTTATCKKKQKKIVKIKINDTKINDITDRAVKTIEVRLGVADLFQTPAIFSSI
jgi:hypothetical protein